MISRRPINRIETVALQVPQPADARQVQDDLALLIPRESEPYLFKQLTYIMDGIYTGDLLLSSDH